LKRLGPDGGAEFMKYGTQGEDVETDLWKVGSGVLCLD
jgi:hypothetical protein